MGFKLIDRFHKQGRAVSPVIGVILMVAVTVIIAAVIGSAALGMGDEISETPPQASLSVEQEYTHIEATGWNYANYTVVSITHDGGDNFDYSDVRVEINGEQAWGFFNDTSASCGSAPCHASQSVWNGDGTATAGDEITILTTDSPSMVEGHHYKISPGGDREDPDSSKLYLDHTGDEKEISLDHGDTIRVLWESRSGDRSTELAEYEVQ